MERLTSPGWRLTELLNGKRTTLNACCAVIHDFATDIIQQRRQLLADHDSALSRAAVSPAGPDAGAGTASPATGAADAAADMSVKGQGADGGAQDLLSLFMKSKNADGQLLSDKQLVDTVINFIIAGRDTTAQVGVRLISSSVLTWQQLVGLLMKMALVGACPVHPAQGLLTWFVKSGGGADATWKFILFSAC